jgi:hypothetical protein
MSNNIFNIVDYPQIKVSACLKHLEDRIASKYNLKKFEHACDRHINTIFFGMYTFSDVHLVSKHKGDIAVIYGGSDIEVLKNHPKMLNKFNTIKISHHIAISLDIQNRLNEMGICSVLFNLNLVNDILFQPVTKTGTKVFIYNGLSEGHEETYGKIYYDQIVNTFPTLEFVYSNKLGLPYEQMPNVYKDCFIGLRLTEHDGNANMVQEMTKMGIPVVHNGEQGGIKWKSVDDVIKIINKYSNSTNKPTTVNTKDNKNNELTKERNTIVINCDTHIDIIDGCTMWLTNTINKYIGENKKVVLINIYNVNNIDNFMRNIVDVNMLEIVNVRAGEVITNVKKYAQLDNVKSVIIRNKNILRQLCDVPHASQKLIVYGLDIHVNEIKNLDNNFYEIWTQSDKLRQLFLDSGVDEKKIKVMPPIATTYEFDNNDKPCDNILRFIYAGTIRDEECILEMVEEFSKIYLNDKNISLTVAYGKIIGNIEFMTKINKMISEGVDGITFMYNLSHLDTCRQIFMSDIGLCCRKNGWGTNGEISTKMTEYETYGLQICDNVAKMRSVVRQNIIDRNEFDVLIHTNVDLDVTNGDNIWLSTMINTLHLDNKRILYLPIGTPKTNNFIRNVIKTNLLTILPCKNIGDVYDKLNEMCSSRTKQIILRHDRIIKCIPDDCKWINLVDFYCYTNNCKEMIRFNGKCNSVNTYDEDLHKAFVEYGINTVLQKHAVWDYKFDLVERNDEEIRLIYVGTLRDEENTLEIIEKFQKIHIERPEVLLTIVYGNIRGDETFKNKINKIINDGVDGITFKHNLAHRDTCHEIAISDVGICWRKDEQKKNVGDNIGKYTIYGLSVCSKIDDTTMFYNMNNINDKYLHKKNIYVFLKSFNYEYLQIYTYNESSSEKKIYVSIDNFMLPNSEILLGNTYVTPNYVDSKIFGKFKCLKITGDFISKINIKTIKQSDIKYNDETFTCVDEQKEEKYVTSTIFKNKLAFIGDTFTFNSLNDILNVTYISKINVASFDVNEHDILLCESTWHGMDGTWKYAFSEYKKKIYSNELTSIINIFKSNGKKCVYYNKEDPTNYEKFCDVASLFDIIITTSEKCVLKYKSLYPNKIIFSRPFCCNPIKHNPIFNEQKKIKSACFIGGFYKHLGSRSDETSEMFDKVIENDVDLKIINRHYFYPKITSQLQFANHFKGRYEISNKYEIYNNPPVSSDNVEKYYKKHILQLNVNTVTDCNTMSSRRLIELLACGCNVYSNNSLSIKYLKLPVITSMSGLNINSLQNVNIDGFYETHMNFSYEHLIGQIWNNAGINLTENMSYQIICNDKMYIDNKYTKFIKIDSDTKFLFQKEKYYYDETFIQKIIVYTKFFNGNVAFLDDDTKWFKVYKLEEITYDMIICNKKSNDVLFIPSLYNQLYENCFNVIPYYKNVKLSNVIDKNGILVVMCVWKRLEYLHKTIEYLESQQTDSCINLCIWNNNYSTKYQIDEIINNCLTKKVNICVHHSEDNIGGIGRFVFVKYVCDNIHNFENVVFIDDDQEFTSDAMSILTNNVGKKKSYNWSGKKFYKDKGYWNCYSNIWPKLRTDYDIVNFDENFLDYGGTGFMIINTECFLKNDFFMFNEKYKFIEDLWMSYYVINKLGYKIQNGKEIKNKVTIFNGENNNPVAQVNILKNLKDEFLNVLRKDGNWDV